MTITLNICIAAYSLLIIYIQASYQAKRFAKNKGISHLGKGFLYSLFIALLTAVMMWGRWDNIWHEHRLWGIPVIGLVTRVAFFDLWLNFLRRKIWWYNSTQDTKSKGSLTDRLENKLGLKWVKVLKRGYFAAFFLIIILLK